MKIKITPMYESDFYVIMLSVKKPREFLDKIEITEKTKSGVVTYYHSRERNDPVFMYSNADFISQAASGFSREKAKSKDNLAAGAKNISFMIDKKIEPNIISMIISIIDENELINVKTTLKVSEVNVIGVNYISNISADLIDKVVAILSEELDIRVVKDGSKGNVINLSVD